MNHIIIVLFSTLLLISCQKKTLSLKDLKTLDLTEKGVPVSIKTPVNPKIIVDTSRVKLIMATSLEIAADNYHIRAEVVSNEMANPSMNADTVKRARLNQEQVNITKGKFESVVVDEPQGFVYKTNAPMKGDTYHFFYVLFKDGKQIEFSDFTGASESFSEDEAKLMYESVKQ